MRQRAPDNHVLDLVVVCTLSPLCMLLLCAALSLLNCVRPCIHQGLLYTTQTRATPGTVISRAPLNPADLSSSASSSMHISPLSRSGPGSTHGDEHGCRSQHVSNSNSASVKHLSLLPSPTASSQSTLPHSIHHLSSIIYHQWQLPISSLLSHRLDFPDIQ